MKTIITTDIHGCALEFRAILEMAGLRRAEDTLIVLGDLFDRGKRSYEVYQFLVQLKKEMGRRLIIVRGNHDQFLLEYLDHLDTIGLWDFNGGRRTIESFERHGEPLTNAGEFLRDTPLYYETDQFIAVHAGLVSEHAEENSPEILMWDRGVLQGNYRGKLGIGGHTPVEDPVYFMPDGTPLILRYETPITLPEKGFICLDTGCVFGRKLTAMVLFGDTFRLIQMKYRGY